MFLSLSLHLLLQLSYYLAEDVFFYASQASANREASVELKSCAKEGKEESLFLHAWLKLFPTRKVLAYEENA